jgi:flagellar protein FlaG
MTIQPLTGLPAATAPAPVPASTRSPPAPTADVAHVAPSSVDPGQLRQAVASINRQLSDASKNVRFSLDERTGHVIVRVVDTETNQIIRQIPSEEALAISQSIEQLQGLLVHLKA